MEGLFSLLLALLLLISPDGGGNNSSRRDSPPANPPVGQGVTPAVPSPALLPGAIGFGLALIKKKREEAQV
jgi:hypothetical protein